MSVKLFSEMKNNPSKITKEAKVNSLVASVKKVADTIDTVEATSNRIYKAFNQPQAKFTKEQVHKIMIACKKMNSSLSEDLQVTYGNLKTAIHQNLPNDEIAAQLEGLSGLRAKLAILRAHAAASLNLVKAEGEEEDFIELDENGVVVDDFDPVEDVVEEEPMVEEEEILEEAATVAEEEEIVEEEIVEEETASVKAEDEELVEEEPFIEVEDSIDDAVGEEILGPEDEELYEEEEVEASLQAKKIASSKKGKGGVGEDTQMLAGMIEDELLK